MALFNVITQKYSAKKIFLIFLPALLLISTYYAYTCFVQLWGLKVGYLSGFIFYWLFWCLIIPYCVIGKGGVKDILRSSPLTNGKRQWINILLLLIPPLLAILFGPFMGRILKTTFFIGILSLVIAVVNAVSEEILWRGVYIKVFPGKYFLGYIYPAIGFAVWHLVPNTVYTSSYGVVPFIMSALLIGLCWGFVAFRTGSIRWVIISHIILDFSGLGALFYFS